MVKELQSHEIDSLVQFVNQAYRGESSKKGWTTEADFLGGQRIDASMVKDAMTNKDRSILVIETEGKLDSCCEVKLHGSDAVEIGMICVSPERQGQGLGKRMIQLAEAYALEKWPQLCRFEMFVISERPELIQWYKKLGFKDTGRRAPFPMNDPKYGIPKVEKIEFIIMDKAAG